MKNAFYFMLKAFLFLRCLHFCPDFLVMQKNGLMKKKLRLTPTFMTSQIGQQIIATQLLSNIPRSKSNQTMKFGQLNIFLKESYTKCGEKASFRPFCRT